MGRKASVRVHSPGGLTAEQAEIARLRRQLERAERRLATTEVALSIMGRAREVLGGLTKSSQGDAESTKP